MILRPLKKTTIKELDKINRHESLWYENNERFVIIEKFESNKCRTLVGNDISFVNEYENLHRNNGNPSFVSAHMIAWHKNGHSHRTNGRPAIIRNTKHLVGLGNISLSPKEEYMINGVYHRDFDLPAVVFSNTNTHLFWFQNGKLHRDNNNPAIINGNILHYYNHGELYKSEICYDNKIINWIMKNPFKLFAILFVLINLITFIFYF